MKQCLSLSLVLLLSLFPGCKTAETVLVPPAEELTAAQEAKPSAAAVPDLSGIEKMNTLGKKMVFLDQLAWRATDILLAAQIDPVAINLYGWITYPDGDNWVVRFLKSDDGVVPSHDVIFPETGEPRLVQSQDSALTDRDRALLTARDAVLEAVTEPCSGTYNTIVFDMPDEKAVYAYAIAASHEPGVIVVGGHYRVILSSDDLTVTSTRNFTTTCLEINDLELQDGEKVTAAIVSHILDPSPVEMHVFLSLTYGYPFYVITESGLWSVIDGKIDWIQDLASLEEEQENDSDD